MTFIITEKQLRIAIATGVAIVLAAICLWVLLPNKNVADACVATGRTASGELIYPANCTRPTGSDGNSAPYQSGVNSQRTPTQQKTFDRLMGDADRITKKCGPGRDWIAELQICGIPPDSPLSKMPSSGTCLPGTVYSWERGSCVPQ